MSIWFVAVRAVSLLTGLKVQLQNNELVDGIKPATMEKYVHV